MYYKATIEDIDGKKASAISNNLCVSIAMASQQATLRGFSPFSKLYCKSQGNTKRGIIGKIY